MYVCLAICPCRATAIMVRVCVPVNCEVSNTWSKVPTWCDVGVTVIKQCVTRYRDHSHGRGSSLSTEHVSDSKTLSVSHVMLTFPSERSSFLQVSWSDASSTTKQSEWKALKWHCTASITNQLTPEASLEFYPIGEIEAILILNCYFQNVWTLTKLYQVNQH